MTPGNSCTLQVEFAPVTVGGHGDILTLSTNGPSNPTVALHGVASGVGTEMETPLEFGTISSGSTETLLLTINNIGGARDSHVRHEDQRPQLQDPDRPAKYLPRAASGQATAAHCRWSSIQWRSATMTTSSPSLQPGRRALHGLPPRYCRLAQHLRMHPKARSS